MKRAKDGARLDRCVRHPRRKAVCVWAICSDGTDRGICGECDLDLNKMALKWAFPKTWRAKYAAYEKAMRS